MSSFYMVLPSNSCPNTRPNNSANKFTIDYENTINLDGDWEVAMTDILLLYCPQTIKQGTSIIYQTSEKRQHKMEMKNKKIIFTPPFPEISNITYAQSTLSIYLNKKVAIKFKSLLDAQAWGFTGTIVRGDANIRFYELQPSTSSVDIEVVSWLDVEEKYVFEKDLFLNTINDIIDYFKKHCSHIFKAVSVDSNLFSWELQDTILSARTVPQLSVILGLKDSNFAKKGSAERPMKLNSSFNQIYIYSSIVEPIMVGSDRVPLLRCTWIDTTKYKGGDVV